MSTAFIPKAKKTPKIPPIHVETEILMKFILYYYCLTLIVVL
jgi:hypothetical protein